MPRRLAQQRMTLRDLEWPFHASRAISAVVEFLVTCCNTSVLYILQSRSSNLGSRHQFFVSVAVNSAYSVQRLNCEGWGCMGLGLVVAKHTAKIRQA